MDFWDTSTAGNGTFTNDGSIYFHHNSSAANGTFTSSGGIGSGEFGHAIYFLDSSTADNATLTAHGGIDGGAGAIVEFDNQSTGGTACIKVFGNGILGIGAYTGSGITIGSLEGDGQVFLRSYTLTVGANNLSTKFSGVMNDGADRGSLTKIGTGTLTLGGPNTYSGATTIQAGTLLVKNTRGSGTGGGPVQVIGGTLGGRGTIAGAVTVGTDSGEDAFLAPGKSANHPTTLTIQDTLTFKADGTYTYKLNTKKAQADQVSANGVTIDSGALFTINAVGNNPLTPGTIFTAIDNTAASSIAGTFSNLADGSIFTVGNNTFQASYEGGDGNDLTLTVVP